MGLYDYRHIIANERTCYWFIHRLRWPEGVVCPGCGARHPYAMREDGAVRYRCRGCARHFSLRTGTALAGSRLPLTKWVLAIALFRIGISARALARELTVSRQSAWELLHRLRDALQSDVLARKLRGCIEVDETYVGGRHKGKRGRGAAHKTVVIGLKVRDGRVRSLVIPSVATAEIHRILKGHVAKGARLFTDELSSYRRVRRLGYRHRRVKHSERFVRGQSHTQAIEGHWGHVKPNLVARHRSVSPRHLQRYLVEADFKHRLPEDTDFIALMLHRLLAPTAVLPRH
jgi:transposase-like protein